MSAYLPFGAPPRADIDVAARLLIRYQDANLLCQEFGEMFYRLVNDAAAIVRRANELRKQAAQ